MRRPTRFSIRTWHSKLRRKTRTRTFWFLNTMCSSHSRVSTDAINQKVSLHGYRWHARFYILGSVDHLIIFESWFKLPIWFHVGLSHVCNVYDFVKNSEQNLIVMDLQGKNLDSSKSGQLNLVMRFEDMNDDGIKLCSSFLLYMIFI
jgi:hypothetical protein